MQKRVLEDTLFLCPFCFTEDFLLFPKGTLGLLFFLMEEIVLNLQYGILSDPNQLAPISSV